MVTWWIVAFLRNDITQCLLTASNCHDSAIYNLYAFSCSNRAAHTINARDTAVKIQAITRLV